MKRYIVNPKTAGVLVTITLFTFAIFQGISAAGLRQATLDGFDGSLTREQLVSLQFSTLLTATSFTIGCFAVAVGVLTYFVTRRKSSNAATLNISSL